MYFYLSIGTNINPERNAVKVVKSLCQHFGLLTLYPFVYTTPEAISSDSIFLNSLAIIHSKKNEGDIKQILNTIEMTLGRDRSDPQKSIKDRTADVDILLCDTHYSLSLFDRFTDNYIQSCLPPNTPANLSAQGLPTYQGASTIDLDRTTGEIVIIEDKLNRLING